MMQEVAEIFNVPFIKADFAEDDSMKAIGLFEHKGVKAHPGDKGMAAIAKCILSGLFNKNA